MNQGDTNTRWRANDLGFRGVSLFGKRLEKVVPPPTPVPPGVLRWTGEIPPQKWMNFYTKVLSRFAMGKRLKLTVTFEVKTEQQVSKQTVEETKTALQELGLKDDVEAS